MIEVLVNGIAEKIQDFRILTYLENKNINKDRVVVEINGKIIKKEELADYLLKDQDKIEIIRFIGGG